jgi:hypothetical protein
MTYRVFATLTSSLLLLLGLSTSPAPAQNWGQEIQIVSAVGYGEPLQVFVDSLSAVLQRNPSIQVRRTAQDEATMSFATLREELFDDGVDLKSASHVFIRYQFNLERSSQVTETIEDLYFIYRGNEARADLPLLHVSAREPVVNDLLRNSGIPSPVNMRSTTAFRSMLAFPRLYRQETAVVEIGGQPVRDETNQAEMVVTHFLTEQMNLGGGSYVLSLPRSMAAEKVTALSPTGSNR